MPGGSVETVDFFEDGQERITPIPMRPRCPACNARNPVSYGDTWRCRACGKRWVKQSRPMNYVSRRRIPGPRPMCIECGSEHVISFGTTWGCVTCGRRWVKRRRTKP